MSYNNYQNNILNITPRTHISVETNNKASNKNGNYINNNDLKKLKKDDLVDIGLKKLIYLGKIIKNYMPKKNMLYNRKNLLELKQSSSKKLTPFQIYLKIKNKNINLAKITRKNNLLDINLKTFNSEKNIHSKKIPKINLNLISASPSYKYQHQNTINCNFKNKLIKSFFEKDELKQDFMRIKTINCTTKKSQNNNKKLNDENKERIHIKDKIFKLNKNKILKKRKNIFKEIKLKNSHNIKTMTEENHKNAYNKLPLINFYNYDLSSNQNFCDEIIKKNIKCHLINKQNKKRKIC